VSIPNKVKHIDQIERVLWLLWEDFSSGPWMPEAAAGYFVHKMTHILFSYYVTALLMNPDRKAGRAQARTLRELVKARAGCLYRASEARYWGTMALHFMGLSWDSLMTLHHSPLYQLLFKATS
jgi:hypothetical protein